MKKVLCVLFATAMMASGCASVNTATVDGKTVVTATRAAPVIVTALGAPLSKCLADLQAKGVKTSQTVPIVPSSRPDLRPASNRRRELPTLTLRSS